MGYKKYIPDFLLATEDPQPPTRIFDAPLRRPLFHKAKEGNEDTIAASRNGSVSSERRSSEGRQPWTQDGSFPVPYGRTSVSSHEHNAFQVHKHQQKEQMHLHGEFRMAD